MLFRSWFDVRIEAGLDRGLSLGRNALDYLLTDLDYKAQQVARELNGAPALSATLKLPALRNQLGVHEIAVFDRHGQLIAAAGEPGAGAEPPQAPSREVLERIANGQPFRTTETLAGRGMVLQASAVKKVALAHAIPVAQPERLKDPATHEPIRAACAR